MSDMVFEKEQIDPQCGLGLSPVGQMVSMKLKIRMASLGISRHVRNITMSTSWPYDLYSAGDK